MSQNRKKSTVFSKAKRFKYQYECMKICLFYFMLGVLWIYFSDRLAFFIAPSSSALLLMNTYKGWFYVIITTLILYVVLRNFMMKVERSEKDIIYLSYYDVLTGLHNRRYYEMVVKELDREENLPMAVIMADVNGLKMINDAFGHLMGDELLQKGAEIIKTLGRPDDVAARWGGDEFVILLPKTSAAEVEQIAGKIQERCIHESVNRISVSMSLGWACKESMEESFSKVLKTAEDGMYKNKIIQNEGLRGNIINTIVNTLYEKNPREEKHSERVGEVAAKLGEAIGFTEIEIKRIRVIGHLHDIGKIAVDEAILNKAGRLTEKEQEEIQRHPDVGYRILSASNEMLELADCVHAHHERWDGKGYPRGLSEQAIPLEARIIALADSYDAMSSERPYRKALNEDVILYEIKRNAGFQFDPELAKIFVEKVLEKSWD